MLGGCVLGEIGIEIKVKLGELGPWSGMDRKVFLQYNKQTNKNRIEE